MLSNMLLAGALGFTLLHGQTLPSEQKQRVDEAVPAKAAAKPKKPRRLLVSSLEMRDGHPWHGSSYDFIPVAGYAIGEMGKRTGAFEAVFSNDVEMFRPQRIRRFDAICFLNTNGVLFEDPELNATAALLLSSLAARFTCFSTAWPPRAGWSGSWRPPSLWIRRKTGFDPWETPRLRASKRAST
jgi:hypothetical protein